MKNFAGVIIIPLRFSATMVSQPWCLGGICRPTYFDVSVLVSRHLSEAEGGHVAPQAKRLVEATPRFTGIYQIGRK